MSAGAEELAAQPDRLLVRPEDAADRLLSVHWPFRESPVVKPALVRACVEEALRRGWPDRLAVLEMAGAEVPSPGEG